jgi:hypothetical protein
MAGLATGMRIPLPLGLSESLKFVCSPKAFALHGLHMATGFLARAAGPFDWIKPGKLEHLFTQRHLYRISKLL